jgi:DNA polymerase III sliding clamp (beta) subunit (PCNA family)
MHIQIQADKLTTILDAILSHAGQSDHRAEHHAVHIEKSDDGIAFITTDGHRMAMWASDARIVSAKKATNVRFDLRRAKLLLASLKQLPADQRKLYFADIKTANGLITVSETETNVRSFSMKTPMAESATPFRKVIPDIAKLSTGGFFAANPKFINGAHRAFLVASRGAPSSLNSVQMFSFGELDPVVFRAEAVPELMVIVMPMRVDQRATWKAVA